MDTLFFTNDEIKFTRSVLKGGKLILEDAASYPLNENCLINGIITNGEIVAEKIIEIAHIHKISKINLCVDSTAVLSKVKKFPASSQKNILKFVKTEFSDIANNFEDAMYDYSILSKDADDKNSIIVLAVCCERSFVKTYLDLFSSIKIKVLSMDMGIDSVINICQNIFSEISDSYIVALVEDTNIALHLFVSGIYYFSTRSRILHQHESTEFMNEFVQRISSINQFNKSQKNEKDIKDIFIHGVNSNIIDTCNTAVGVMSLKAIQLTGTEKLVQSTLSSAQLQDYIYNLGSALIKR